MTFRSVVIGLAGAVLVAAGGYYVDHALRLNRFVSGLFPISVYGPLVLVVLLGPPAVFLLRRRGLRPAELAVIAATMLAACSIPSNGLLRYFTRCLVMPAYYNRTTPGWRDQGIVETLPPVLLVNDGKYDHDVTVGFISGLGREGHPIGISEVPWAPWALPLAVWGALILLFAGASICLALIVHPQWTRRERLLYPIAEFVNTMLSPGKPGGPGGHGPIYRSSWFWIGLAALFVYHVNNGLYRWWPETFVHIPLQFDFSAIMVKFPWLRFGWGWYRIAYPTFWPIAVALAFFLAKDITFSVGICQPVATVLGAALLHMGLLRAEGNFVTGQPFHWQRAGSCLALALMLLYLGRRYYLSVLRRAVTFRPGAQEVEGYAVVACRGLLLCLAALTAILVWVIGVDWPLAVAFVLLTMVGYLAVARITAEFGIYYVQIIWFPVSVLIGLLGYAALGPAGLVTLAMLSTVFMAQPEESVMAFAVHGLRIGQGQRVGAGRLGTAVLAGFVLAAAVAIPFAVWVDYNYGGCRAMWWDSHGQPRVPFTVLQRAKTDLKLTGELAASEAMGPWQRITNMDPDGTFVRWFAMGVAAVGVTYVLRLRFPWWPIHPVMFLIWETWGSAAFFHSFLLAWVLQLVVGYFGTRNIRAGAKQFMVGVIAGELLGGMLWMCVGAAFYGATGRDPPGYNIFPY